MSELRAATWPQVESGSCLVLPLGSTEQHGPHLPFATDTIIATALAQHLGKKRSVTVAPAVPYGASGEHQAFAGTLSIGNNVLHELIVELVRSATCTFAGVYLINGHGGNAAALASATKQLTYEGRDVRVFAPRIDADLHAGHFETSLLLHLDPGMVRLDALEVGDTRSMQQLWPSLQHDGVRSITANGILGDPTNASAQIGAELFGSLCDQLLDDFDEWQYSRTNNQGKEHG